MRACVVAAGLGIVVAAQVQTAGAQTDYARVGLESAGAAFRGIVECNAALDLAFPVAGIVASVDVVEGEDVADGQTLIRLDQRMEEIETERRLHLWQDRADIEATETQISLAREQLAAAERIFAQSRGISLEELQNRRLSLALLIAERARIESRKVVERLDWETAEETLARRTLTAPTGGAVAEILREVGESVQPSDVVVRLCDTSRLLVTANLPARRTLGLVDGGAVEIRTDAGAALAGTVAFLSPVIDPASGLRRVRIALDTPPDWLQPGASLTLTLAAE